MIEGLILKEWEGKISWEEEGGTKAFGKEVERRQANG